MRPIIKMNKPSYAQYREEDRAYGVDMYYKYGYSMNKTARLLGVSYPTLKSWVDKNTTKVEDIVITTIDTVYIDGVKYVQYIKPTVINVNGVDYVREGV